MAHLTTDVAQGIYETSSRNFVHYYLSYAQNFRLDFHAQAMELSNCQIALSICKQNQWWAEFGRLLEAVRFVLQERGYWNEYREWLESILKQPEGFADRLNDQELYLTLLDDYAALSYVKGERDLAVEIYQEIIKRADQQQQLVKAYAHYGLGEVYFAAGHHTKAAEQWRLASSIADQSGESGLAAITNYFLKRSDNDAPRISMEIKPGQSFPKAKIWKQYVTEHFRARRFFDAEKLSEAKEAYTLVCNLAKQLDDRDGLAMALFHLGDIARMMEQPSLALRYYHSSEQIAQNLNNQIGLASVYAGISYIYLGQERYDLARPYLEECVRLERKFGNDEALAEQLFMLGYARANTGSLNEAIASFQEAKALFSRFLPKRAENVEQALNRLKTVMDKSK